ncbi:Rha family transcriptional regulator [Escherichia coli]|nr:Rha family transcriptional regulator [Escherichia coli]
MNSLTANNRLSQQLVVSVAEHLLLRHECRLPNHLAVSNHRELYLTVGGELCRNLTAGFVTEEDFMFMLFVGSQKHSALSIFAKTTRMSALVLCGNSGVILLSVKDHQHIDSAIPGRYTVQAPYKAGAGIGVLEKATAYNRVDTEAAIMATIPTFVHPEITIINGRAVTTSLAVANYFTKRHERVLDRIRNLECSAEFAEHNFVLSGYTDASGRKLPCYQITRDGFAFLAMGFTGKRAAQFKKAYINAFNQMEKQLSKPSVPSDVAHNASVLYSYISSIHQVWLQQLYPMLEKAESPLAVSLYDRINDAAFLARLIHSSLNSSEVRGRK